MNAPTLEETVERIKREITDESRIPDTCATFSEVHDYIDANELGGFCEEELNASFRKHFGGPEAADTMPDGFIDFVNKAQDAIDVWLKAGGLKEARRAPITRSVFDQMVKALEMAQAEALTLYPRLPAIYARNVKAVAEACGDALKSAKGGAA